MVAHGVRCWPPALVEQFRCLDCGAWLSLGPSNDEPDSVKVEIAAAAQAASYRDQNYRPGPDRFEYCPTTKSERLCDLCESIYLAHAIAAHDLTAPLDAGEGGR
jgi:hypothetical protein